MKNWLIEKLNCVPMYSVEAMKTEWEEKLFHAEDTARLRGEMNEGLRESALAYRNQFLACEDALARSRRSEANTKGLMQTHVWGGMTRVVEVGNHRLQLDVPSEGTASKRELVKGFVELMASADLPIGADHIPSLPLIFEDAEGDK